MKTEDINQEVSQEDRKLKHCNKCNAEYSRYTKPGTRCIIVKCDGEVV